MTFERTRDWELVKQIVTHPKVYPYISDDFSPKPEAWEPVKEEVVIYVLVRDGEELLGLWIFVPLNGVCMDVHTCLLPNAYGHKAVEAAKEMAVWLWENTACHRLVTEVPASNPLARRFAERAGMVEFGCNPRSFLKRGKLEDQYLLGMSRPEELCHLPQ